MKHAGAAIILFVMATGLAIAALTKDPGLNVPPAIAFVLAAGLMAAAAATLSVRVGRQRFATGAVVLLLVAFTTTAAWIAFGSGRRSCAVSTFGIGATESGLACRSAFGVAAVLCALITAFAAWQWYRSR